MPSADRLNQVGSVAAGAGTAAQLQDDIVNNLRIDNACNVEWQSSLSLKLEAQDDLEVAGECTATVAEAGSDHHQWWNLDVASSYHGEAARPSDELTRLERAGGQVAVVGDGKFKRGAGTC